MDPSSRSNLLIGVNGGWLAAAQQRDFTDDLNLLTRQQGQSGSVVN